MDETCATCRWWDWRGFNDAQPTPLWGFCLLVGAGTLEVKPREHAKALAEFSTEEGDCQANLETAPGFGCNQWEPKPTT